MSRDSERSWTTSIPKLTYKLANETNYWPMTSYGLNEDFHFSHKINSTITSTVCHWWFQFRQNICSRILLPSSHFHAMLKFLLYIEPLWRCNFFFQWINAKRLKTAEAANFQFKHYYWDKVQTHHQDFCRMLLVLSRRWWRWKATDVSHYEVAKWREQLKAQLMAISAISQF